jgi:hypothetical protein
MKTDLRQELNKSGENSYGIFLDQQRSLAVHLATYSLPRPAFNATPTNPTTGQHKELAESNSYLHNSLHARFEIFNTTNVPRSRSRAY